MSALIEPAKKIEKPSKISRAGKAALRLSKLELDLLGASDQKKKAEQSDQGIEASELAELQYRIAEKKVELFAREHDSTGALKRGRLGQDMAKELRARAFERNEEGELVEHKDDERSHFLLINMGELDRLNTSGGHALGDQGLRLAAQKIESVVREVLGGDSVFKDPAFKDKHRLADAYEIYRYSGNDFAVRLRDVDVAMAEEIKTRLSQESVDISSVKPGEESVPLTSSMVSLENGIELFNKLDDLPEDAEMTQRIVIDAMFELAQTANDIAKIESRTKRLIEKIIKISTPEDELAVKESYEKFIKKSLGSVFRTDPKNDLLGYDAFRQLVTDNGGLEGALAWDHFVTERSFNEAFENLKARRAVGREVELNLARLIAEGTLNRWESFGQEISDELQSISDAGFVAPKQTRGTLDLVKFEKKTEQTELLRLQGPIYDAQADLANVQYDIEKAKRNEKTGLFGRGVYFEDMEKALKDGKPLATIAIDLGFLKYFDKEGGPGTGNMAIGKAAEILDEVSAELSSEGVLVTAYHVGGDEFAFSVVGGDDETIELVLKRVMEKADNAGRVPASEGAKPSYQPEKIRFNYGIRRAESAESFRQELERAGIPLKEQGTEREYNELADYFARLADKEIDIQKGVDRLMFLINRRLKERKSGNKTNVSTLIDYSQKVFFGDREAGMRMIESCVDRLEKTPSYEIERGKIRGEMITFVIGQLDAQNAKETKYDRSLDIKIEDAVRIRYFEHRISELEDKIVFLETKIQTQDKSHGSLRDAVTAAEEEKRAIIELRERMNKRKSADEDSSVRKAA
jgi:GGDEF domain-containing protein